MKSISAILIATSTFFVMSLFAYHSQSDVLSAIGGLAFGRSGGFEDIKIASPILGAEYTFGIGQKIQLGGFYDRQMLNFSNGSVGSLNFVGAVARYHFAGSEHSGPFAFTKLGLGGMNDNTTDSHEKFSYGAGLGYQVVLSSFLSISPRLSVSYLPDSSSGDASSIPRYEGSVMVSFHF